MSTITPTSTPIPVPVLPTNTPKWISNAVKGLLVLVPILLAWLHPGGSFTSANAQQAIVIVGIILAASVHLIETFVENLKTYGLGKAMLQHDVNDSITWVDTNIGDLKAVYASLHELIGHVVAGNSLVQSLEGDVKAVEAKIAEIPGADLDALKVIIEDEIRKFLGNPATAAYAAGVTK